MNTLSRTITGLVMIIGGLVLLGVGIFHWGSEGNWVALMYGVLAFVLGFFVLFNKKEDEIEQINTAGYTQGRVPSNKRDNGGQNNGK
jgi:hypothetical protein